MTEVIDSPGRTVRGGVAVWAARLFVALVFIYVGVIKLPSDGGLWVRLFDQIGAGQWFRYMTAAVEITGGALMLWPRATPVAVFLNASAMAGALITHAAVTGFGPQTVAASVLLILNLLVGWSHHRRR